MKTKEIIEQAQIQDGLTARKQPTLFKLMIEELRNTYAEFGDDLNQLVDESKLTEICLKADMSY